MNDLLRGGAVDGVARHVAVVPAKTDYLKDQQQEFTLV